MHWTDYWRLKEQVGMVEVSVLRLRRMLESGAVEKVEMEAVCLTFNLQILMHMKTKLRDFIISAGLERKAIILLNDSYSYMEEHGGKEKWKKQMNQTHLKKVSGQATVQQAFL